MPYYHMLRARTTFRTVKTASHDSNRLTINYTNQKQWCLFCFGRMFIQTSSVVCWMLALLIKICIKVMRTSEKRLHIRIKCIYFSHKVFFATRHAEREMNFEVSNHLPSFHDIGFIWLTWAEMNPFYFETLNGMIFIHIGTWSRNVWNVRNGMFVASHHGWC